MFGLTALGLRIIGSIALLLGGAVSFGCEDCPIEPDRPCETIALTGGMADEFDRGNSEPAILHPDFRAILETRANPIEPNFDGTTINRHFGHSFRLAGNDKGCIGKRVVKSAELTMRLRARGDGSTDQTHWYIRNAQGELQHVWGALIPRDLSDGSWTAGETQTFVFDLSAMPPGGSNSESNLLPYLENGELHVHVQDDTSVDFITLETVSCCEEEHVGH